jgi:hypothetical protein
LDSKATHVFAPSFFSPLSFAPKAPPEKRLPAGAAWGVAVVVVEEAGAAALKGRED